MSNPFSYAVTAAQEAAFNRDDAEKVTYAAIKMFLQDTLDEGRDAELEHAFNLVKREFERQTAGPSFLGRALG